MGDWEQILLERRLLWWTSLLVLAGTGLWVLALATPYWLVHLPGNNTHTPETTAGGRTRELVWAHTGIWTKCDLVEVGVAGAGEAGLRWECWDMISLQSQSTLIRSELSVAGVGALLTVAATLFSCYSISHPRYTYRRLAAVLHTLAAVCVLVVIQLVDGGARTIMRVEDERGDSLLYGYSYLLAWVSFLVSASAAVLFLLASRKRKLLDSDQVNYNNQQLDIEVKT